MAKERDKGMEAARGNSAAAADGTVRDRILAAAFASFRENGFGRASTLDIATRARVSKRELYSLFGSKQQMLIACISERTQQRMRLPADWPAPRDRKALEACLYEFGCVMVREISDPNVIAVFRIAISEADHSPEVARALNTYGRQQSFGALREILAGAQASGLLAGVDLDRFAGYFMSLLMGDVVMGLALGLRKRPTAKEIEQRARGATQACLALAQGPVLKLPATP